MKFLAVLVILLSAEITMAQDTTSRVLTIKELFDLTEANAKQLAISRQSIAIADSRVDIAAADRLPEIASSADVGYLGTLVVLNPNFSFHSNVPTPHFLNNYSVGGEEVVFKGGFVRHNVAKAKLSVQVASLNFEKDRQEVKLVLLERYLDLYQLYNSRVIYLENIQLAQRRLRDLRKLREQGLVIHNDLIRSELQVSDFQLDLNHVEDNITIVNNDLCVVLGLPPATRILPDTTLLNQIVADRSFNDYLSIAYQTQPAMRATTINEQINQQNVALEKAAKLPTISLFAGDALNRPFLYTLEPLDIYLNGYQAGIRLQYNISSIYHAKDKIRQARLELAQQQTRTEWQKQQTEIEVNAAYVRYREAKNDLATLQKSLELAVDNFQVVEKKYINQLAQITDMLDASTAKLIAELRVSDARINIVNQWYKLQKASGIF